MPIENEVNVPPIPRKTVLRKIWVEDYEYIQGLADKAGANFPETLHILINLPPHQLPKHSIDQVQQIQEQRDQLAKLIDELCKLMTYVSFILSSNNLKTSPPQHDAALEVQLESMRQGHEKEMMQLNMNMAKQNSDLQMQMAKFTEENNMRRDLINMARASSMESVTAFVDILKSAVEVFAANKNKKESIKE